mmetsp:Transcript_14126/g.45062  ORF Transcript_14126/g.45062 Transcript_14126/m.45062 type:complete len:105 (+) Transcript_14126:212-526(+)|eukprot:CAMPEP_0182863734 /NCGR_PEP_ID=MMETSP0034_2-20130328/6808_1 /TAXON_ID=156128 /ORGANISM="Nephroselmis pyriformis, Strain CCMP717" /LENGTH=104 /DNA_ID=CAMNT_0024995973 /DNA_START=179 /DNA_END=493 /DNA_ORIENTATION=-
MTARCIPYDAEVFKVYHQRTLEERRRRKAEKKAKKEAKRLKRSKSEAGMDVDAPETSVGVTTATGLTGCSTDEGVSPQDPEPVWDRPVFLPRVKKIAAPYVVLW